METVGVEPTSSSLQARRSATRATSPGDADGWSRIPLRARYTRLQPAELTSAQRPRVEGRSAGFEPELRGSRPRVLPLHHDHRDAGFAGVG